jgi:4-hydroxybutyrate dehydrogenase
MRCPPSLRGPVYDRTPSNPTEAAVREAAAHVQRQRGCDGLIAVGGGSSLDCAKGVWPSPPRTTVSARDVCDHRRGVAAKITEAAAPLIAVPTTAGTGSEVARGAILIVDDGRKLGFHNWNLLPRVGACCDPDLTMALPASLTAATGMDAIAHCLETFMVGQVQSARRRHRAGRPASAAGATSSGRSSDGRTDREARWNMMSAAMQGALAFQKGLGCVHSPQPQPGRRESAPAPRHVERGVPAGRCCSSTPSAPSVAQRERRLDRMARAMGLGKAAATFAAAIRDLNARLGLPSAVWPQWALSPRAL